VLQCDICSEHGGRCLPWGNPHLLAKDFGGLRYREPVDASAVNRNPRLWFLALAALQVPRLGSFKLWQSCIGLLSYSSRVALGQGDRLGGANKNPGPPRGPGRADRAAQKLADDTANPRASRDRHSQTCVWHIQRLSPFYDDPDRGPRVLPMVSGRSQTALRGCITSTWKSQPPWPIVLRE
jgi:hypothetical protein